MRFESLSGSSSTEMELLPTNEKRIEMASESEAASSPSLAMLLRSTRKYGNAKGFVLSKRGLCLASGKLDRSTGAANVAVLPLSGENRTSGPDQGHQYSDRVAIMECHRQRLQSLKRIFGSLPMWSRLEGSAPSGRGPRRMSQHASWIKDCRGTIGHACSIAG